MAGGAGDHPDKCKFCAKFTSASDIIKCLNPSCDVIIHVKCFEAIARVINIDKNSFYCRKCSGNNLNLSYDKILLEKEIECLSREKEILNKYVAEMECVNQILKSKTMMGGNRHSLKQPQNSSVTTGENDRSYSGALKNNYSECESVLLVKAMDQNILNSQVDKEIKSKINLSSVRATVDGTRVVKSGVLINCSDPGSLAKLKTCLTTQFGDGYSISEPKKLNPRLIIRGVNADSLNNSSFKSDLISLNELNVTEDDIKVITKVKFKEVFNVVLEMTPALHQRIIEKGFLYIGWNKCYVSEHYHIVTCFKCCKTGHHKKDSRSQLVCPKCSEPHEMKDCTSQIRCCNNCKSLNLKYKLNINVEHIANSSGCSFLLNKIDQLKARIQRL